MRHFLKEKSILCLNLRKSLFHDRFCFGFYFKMRCFAWTFIVYAAFHITKLYLKRMKELDRERCMPKKDKWWAHLLLVAFLAPLDVTSHASFVLNGHSFPSTIHVVASSWKEGILPKTGDETACEVDPASALHDNFNCPRLPPLTRCGFQLFSLRFHRTE